MAPHTEYSTWEHSIGRIHRARFDHFGSTSLPPDFLDVKVPYRVQRYSYNNVNAHVHAHVIIMIVKLVHVLNDNDKH